MHGRRLLVRLIVAVALAAAGCGSAAAPSPTPLPAASSGPAFAAAWCTSMQAMLRAIGNPDTAADSEVSAALDTAITNADYSGVERLAAIIQAELTTGRRHVEAWHGMLEAGRALPPEVTTLLGACHFEGEPSAS